MSSGRVALLPVVTDTQTTGVGNFKTSGRVALLPVFTDTQTKGEATLTRQERCTFHVLITSSDTAISDS